MRIPDAVRSILACPKCHGSLTDSSSGDALDCDVCGLRFPVRDGIPILLLDHATRLER
jgi:uncharacterized protein YbaR (Trm112 family)